ncbi:hypothetical protein D3C78_806300 [compost metagenome]
MQALGSQGGVSGRFKLADYARQVTRKLPQHTERRSMISYWKCLQRRGASMCTSGSSGPFSSLPSRRTGRLGLFVGAFVLALHAAPGAMMGKTYASEAYADFHGYYYFVDQDAGCISPPQIKVTTEDGGLVAYTPTLLPGAWMKPTAWVKTGPLRTLTSDEHRMIFFPDDGNGIEAVLFEQNRDGWILGYAPARVFRFDGNRDPFSTRSGYFILTTSGPFELLRARTADVAELGQVRPRYPVCEK